MVNVVTIISEGYSIKDHTDATVRRASCTCTLIKGENNFNVIVDTMSVWDKEKIMEGLSNHGLSPDEIKAVICTHGHPGHIGNNNIFPHMELCIVGQCISSKDKFIPHDFEQAPFQLSKDISVIASPGHTLSCVSIIVRNNNFNKVVGICGDLFQSISDIYDNTLWLATGSENPSVQEYTRLKLASMVDVIIPGHGPSFDVTDDIRNKLKNIMFS